MEIIHHTKQAVILPKFSNKVTIFPHLYSARCLVPEIKPDQNYPGTKETYTLPITDDILQIDEHLIRYLLTDYKIICKKGRIPATGELNE